MAEPYRNPFLTPPKPQPVVSAAASRDRMVENIIRTGRGLPPLPAAPAIRAPAPAQRPMVSTNASRDRMIHRQARSG